MSDMLLVPPLIKNQLWKIKYGWSKIQVLPTIPKIAFQIQCVKMKFYIKVGNTAIDLFDVGWGYAQSDIIAIFNSFSIGGARSECFATSHIKFAYLIHTTSYAFMIWFLSSANCEIWKRDIMLSVEYLTAYNIPHSISNF